MKQHNNRRVMPFAKNLVLDNTRFRS